MLFSISSTVSPALSLSLSISLSPSISLSFSLSLSLSLSFVQFQRLSGGTGRRGKKNMAAELSNVISFDENDRATSYEALPQKYLTEEKAVRMVCAHVLFFFFPRNESIDEHEVVAAQWVRSLSTVG